jgi:FMN phosphatase YigB (HAD superfamily)
MIAAIFDLDGTLYTGHIGRSPHASSKEISALLLFGHPPANVATLAHGHNT